MISVIIPFYNAGEWIGRLVDSCKQEGDFEFIFVNDGSTDGSEELITGDDRFAVLNNEHKKGVSGARNTGIFYADGEYITFVDADDMMLPDAYSVYTKAIAEDERANLYQFNHYRYYPTIGKTAFKYLNDGGVYSSTNLPKMWFSVWNKLYSADLIKRMKFNEKLNYGEDGLFILECLAKDDYLYHAGRNDSTIKHCFDNPHSLSKTKDEAKLFKYIRELENFTRKQKSPEIRQACCKILSDEWKSPRFMELIGHA